MNGDYTKQIHEIFGNPVPGAMMLLANAVVLTIDNAVEEALEEAKIEHGPTITVTGDSSAFKEAATALGFEKRLRKIEVDYLNLGNELTAHFESIRKRVSALEGSAFSQHNPGRSGN